MPPTSSELIGAVSHPLRRRILLAYIGGSAERATATELADLLDREAAQVAYHLKTLALSEILEPVPNGNGREAGEVHYGWTLAVEPEWLRLVLDVWSESEVSG
jgi:DNA-binding transcriptional ArsR family regulator